MAMFRKLACDTRGATAIEYALVASLISIAAVGAFASLGQGVGSRFTNVQQQVSNRL